MRAGPWAGQGGPQAGRAELFRPVGMNRAGRAGPDRGRAGPQDRHLARLPGPWPSLVGKEEKKKKRKMSEMGKRRRGKEEEEMGKWTEKSLNLLIAGTSH